jgi:hypothetical protein
MDTSYFRNCALLIDEVDLIISKSRTKTGKNGKALVLSRTRKNGPKSVQFNLKKIQLLAALKEHFIEPRTKSLRMSALLIFCHQAGLDLVTYENKTHIRAGFTVRTAGFDLVVSSDD